MVDYVEEGKGEGRGKEKFAGGGVWRSDQAGQPKKGQGTMSLAGSRGGAPCGAWGNAPTAAPLDQLCQTRQFRSTSAEQRSAFSAAVVSLRVRRRAPQSALPITCTLSCRWARPDSMAKQKPCVNSAEAAAHVGQEKDDRLHLILFPNASGNSVEFPKNKHIKKPCGLNPQGSFYRERRTQTFQISFAYCAIVRSEENMPALAMFIRHLRAKDNSSR